MRRSKQRDRTTSSCSRARSTPRGRPLTISTSARDRIAFIVQDLSRRYLPAGDLHTGETALAKIVAETEEPVKVLISTILSQRTRYEMTEVASRQLVSTFDPRA